MSSTLSIVFYLGVAFFSWDASAMVGKKTKVLEQT
jgi:hypothetical protein